MIKDIIEILNKSVKEWYFHPFLGDSSVCCCTMLCGTTGTNQKYDKVLISAV